MVKWAPLAFRRATLDWRRTYIMGVLNVTPDSFSDGGRYLDPEQALARGLALIDDGADIVDVGGESTRPGAAALDARAEKERILPVVAALRDRVTVSVDTYKAEVAEAALATGAEIVNDISGGTLDPALYRVAARHGATVVLGHLRGTPADMPDHARYDDVVREVVDELALRVEHARTAGVRAERIWVDPSLGFAKSAVHDLLLLRDLEQLRALGCPLVIGASRKSFLGRLTGRPVAERELATAAAHTAAILHGADVVRVHDPAVQRDAVRVADAIRRAGDSPARCPSGEPERVVPR